MNGLFLQGGGAKGAFQAGVIYGLYEKGIDFNIISGTSIGAINSYFIYTNNIEKLREVWTTIDIDNIEQDNDDNIVIENKAMIDILEGLKGKNNDVKSVYVNYTKVNNGDLQEVVVDLEKLRKEDKLNAIKYSSLLPCRFKEGVSIEKFIEEFDTEKLFNDFKEDLNKGIYEGYGLDGGILNNNFLEPFINNKVKKLFIITFHKNYKVPQYLLEKYDKNDLIIIEPITKFTHNDTIKFKKEFCNSIFNEGYEIAKNIKKSL